MGSTLQLSVSHFLLIHFSRFQTGTVPASCDPRSLFLQSRRLCGLATVSKLFKRAATDGPTHLRGPSSAACLRPKSWVWRVQSDVMPAGSEGSEGLRTEAARPLKEAPHQRGTEEEADQTREADWERKQK